MLLPMLLACGDDLPTAPSGSSTTTTEGTTAATTSGLATATTGTSTDADETSTPGELPPAPTLLSPLDGATEVPLETELCWTPVEDPDGDALRYRVRVDGIELVPGLPGEPEGFAGPCTGPLSFAYERSYAWEVEAFEADDPTRSSPPSESWGFTTVDDGIASTVFEDELDDDLGWELSGDATRGQWVRTDPVPTSDGGSLSQPSGCATPGGCLITGQNPVGQVDDEDVAGGSTVITSPPFDLGGAATATVQLQRFFYKSDPDPGPALEVELLVPTGRPGQYSAYSLERLEAASTDTPANLWTPVELTACGLPMVDGSRLRLTATDQGAGILEAAIDSVVVRAHDLATVCGSGEGGICDPDAGAAACPAELLCCPQGSIHRGIYRCSTPVASIDPSMPPPAPESPGNGPLGCDAPDLVIDESWIEPVLTDIFVSESTCEYGEGCVGGLGWRTIMRFALTTRNIGSRDLVLGVAANEPYVFHYSDCHSHYHFDEFARYELRDAGGVVATGHKQGFCLLDSYSWAWNNAPGTYDCSNQGISRGHADIYESDLPCQWVDVTDVPPGDYTLRATLNRPRPESALPLLVERDYDNDVVEVPVTLP